MSLTRVTGNIVQDSSLSESKLINPYVNVSGDTMTGTLVLPANGLVAGTNQLVLSSGNVGIGNLSPSYKLDVTGSLRVTGQFITSSTLNAVNISLSSDGTNGSPALLFGNETNTGVYRSTTGTISFSSAGTLAASVSSSSLKINSGILSVTRIGSTNSTDNAIEYESGIDTYHIGRDAASLNFRTSGVSNRIRISSIGQVSIGTASTISGVLLNVAGRVNSSAGYNGILLSDLPTVTTAYGGTGLTSYSTGDLLYYSSGNTLSRLSSPPQESLLLITSDGTPYWSPRPLAVSHGGTGLTSLPSNGQILIGNGTSYTLSTISSGTGITIVNGSGTIGIGVTNIPNSSITNSSVTINTGSGLSGGGSLALGGTLNLISTGVTTLSAGSGITLSSSTGTVLVSNSGVTSAVAGSGITISGATGAVTYSLNPNFAPNFSGLTLGTPLAIPSGGTGITGTPSVNQILYGNNVGGYSKLTVIGVGITVSPDFNANTLTLSANLSGASVSITSNGNSSVNIPQANGSIIATTGNVEALRINTSQNIGIGTTTPNYKIDFGTAFVGNGRIISLASQPASGVFAGIGLSPTSAGGIRIAGTPVAVASSAEIASIGYYSTDGIYTFTPVIYARNDNRVGINHSNPGYTLDVNGDINTTGSLRVGAAGNNHVLGTNDTVTASTGQATLDSFSATTFRTAKYVIQVLNTDNTLYQTSEVLLIHDGTNAYLTEYGVINTGASLGVIDANVSGGNVNLLFTPTYANNKIRVARTLIGIQ
jgi:hypothetical protein